MHIVNALYRRKGPYYNPATAISVGDDKCNQAGKSAHPFYHLHVLLPYRLILK